MNLPCPDPNLPAGLRQRDIDAALFGDAGDPDKYERELERADRWRDEATDRRAETFHRSQPPNQNHT